MTRQPPDPAALSDMIDSLRAAGLGEANAGLAQMAEAIKLLAKAEPAIWARLDGLRDDPAGLAALLGEIAQPDQTGAQDRDTGQGGPLSDGA